MEEGRVMEREREEEGREKERRDRGRVGVVERCTSTD